MRAPQSAAALFLAVLALAPLALADHTFSHRVYVTGRVVDQHGLPIANVPVGLALNFPTAGACFDERSESTSDTGDFILCRHAHALPADPVANLTIAGNSIQRAIDPQLRSVAIAVQVGGDRPRGSIQGDRAFNSTFHVAGRVFDLLPAPQDVENVRVNATPRGGATVTIDVAGAAAQATVDEFGSYATDVPFGAVPDGGKVTVTAGADSWSVDASSLFRRADVDIVAAPHSVDVGVPSPGSSVGKVPAPGLVALVGAITLAACAASRARSRRP